MDLLPNEEEQPQLKKELKKFKKQHADKLGHTERFWYDLSKIPCLRERLSLWDYKNGPQNLSFPRILNNEYWIAIWKIEKKSSNEFDGSAEIINRLLERVDDAITVCKESDKFKILLKVVLALANYCNHQGSNKQSCGFELEGLSSVSCFGIFLLNCRLYLVNSWQIWSQMLMNGLSWCTYKILWFVIKMRRLKKLWHGSRILNPLTMQ